MRWCTTQNGSKIWKKKHEWFDGRRQPIHQCSETQVYTWRDYRVSMSFNFHHLGMPTASQTEVTAQKLLRVCPCDWELEAIIGQKATSSELLVQENGYFRAEHVRHMFFFCHASHFAHGRSIVPNPIVTTKVRLSYLTRLLDNSVEMIKLQSPLNIRKGDQDREAENQQQRVSHPCKAPGGSWKPRESPPSRFMDPKPTLGYTPKP